MKYDPDIHHRRSIRIKGYDYTQGGAYFITICVRGRECLLGSVVDSQVQLSQYGEIADACWQAIPDHFEHVEIDAFVVMPNHIHGIVCIANRDPGKALASSSEHIGKPVSGSIPTIVRSYKAAITKGVNQLQDRPSAPFWQRNYYERIIRDELSLQRIREYIANNPCRWEQDQLHPTHPLTS